MMDQSIINYSLIAKAIDYLDKNFRDQSSLDDVAQAIHLSPYHFQRLFKEWVGVSPKKFLQYTSVEYAKSLLMESKKSLSETAFSTDLSRTTRLHDLFVKIEGLTPAKYKNNGADLLIYYSMQQSPFGSILIASTQIGICYLEFEDDLCKGLENLKKRFKHSQLREGTDENQQKALRIFRADWSNIDEIKLHLKGTDFQIKVWNTLLAVPYGKLITYGRLAKEIGNPSAARAVGTAVGANPIAYLIPCHRVIQASGMSGGYKWNPIRKKIMIGWEGVNGFQKINVNE